MNTVSHSRFKKKSSSLLSICHNLADCNSSDIKIKNFKLNKGNKQKVKMSWQEEILWSKLFSPDSFPLHLIVLQPLAQYWVQSVICDYHHSVALIGWLAFSRREGDAMMEKKFMAALDRGRQKLLTSGQEKTVSFNVRSVFFLQPVVALFITRVIYHGTFGKSLIYLCASLGNVKLDK